MYDNSYMFDRQSSNPTDLLPRASTPQEFGLIYRAERKAQGKTIAQIADAAQCRRQTIADMEMGKNVGLLTVFMALAALGKCVEIKSMRYEFGSMPDLMGEDV